MAILRRTADDIFQAQRSRHPRQHFGRPHLLNITAPSGVVDLCGFVHPIGIVEPGQVDVSLYLLDPTNSVELIGVLICCTEYPPAFKG